LAAEAADAVGNGGVGAIEALRYFVRHQIKIYGAGVDFLDLFT